jgi:cell division protein FtsB
MTGRPDEPRDLPDEPREPASTNQDPGDSLLARGRDLAGLSVAGITRRRIAILMAALLCAWIVLALSRQVGEAADATNRARQLGAANQQLNAQIQTLTEERTLIQQQTYIEIEARAHGLGGRNERPFSLAADAPALAPDAPGSASAALGASPTVTGPLDAWLDLLFGPGR